MPGEKSLDHRYVSRQQRRTCIRHTADGTEIEHAEAAELIKQFKEYGYAGHDSTAPALDIFHGLQRQHHIALQHQGRPLTEAHEHLVEPVVERERQHVDKHILAAVAQVFVE